jgi:hypothetical protein
MTHANHERRFCALVDALSGPDRVLLSEHIEIIRRGAIDECNQGKPVTVSEWMTITIRASGLKQRIRKSSISTYWSEKNQTGPACIIKDGHLIEVAETYAALGAELEARE